MKNLTVTTLMALVVSGSVSGNEVVFEGTPPVNGRAIQRRVLRARIPVDSVRAMLLDEGYLDATVRVEDGRVIVRASEQSTIDRILWTNDSTVQSNIGIPFTQQDLENLIDRRLTEDRNAGFFYSTANVRKVTRAGSAVSVEIFLNPGPRLIMSKAVYNGLTRTAPDLIARYLLLDSGDVIVERDLRRAERRAAEIPFVLFRPPVNVRPLPGYIQADLEYNFVEKKQVLLSGGAGYSPGASSSFVWSLDLAFQNLFGGGRRARLLSERREESRQTLNVSYRQPMFLFGVGDIGLSVATRDYRDQFYEFSLATDYRSRLSDSFSGGLKLGWRSVEPAGDQRAFNAFTSDITIENSTIDNIVNPSSGTSLAWTMAFTYRRYFDDPPVSPPEHTSFNETRTMVKALWFQRLKANLIGHIRFEFLGLQTAESLPPISELFLVGGPPSIRGYRNEQFAAVRTAYGTLEPRYRFNTGYLFSFYDGAYINNRVVDLIGNVVTDESYRHSYGFGAAIVDRERSVRLSLGWSPEVSFDQPRLSIEFSTEI